LIIFGLMKHLFELFYQCSGVSTDSRTIQENYLYIALKGDRFNGNQFALEALNKGARYSIIDEDVEFSDPRIYRVHNGLEFLQQLANYHRSKFSIPFIGITGSNGKTTTKELIVSVLKQKYNVHYTKGNLNNHIGVPLTLLGVNNGHDIAVIEMGANRLKDISELTEIAEPTHGIITNIGAAHLEGFGSLEGVITTKKELYDAVEKVGGTLFYNADDELLSRIKPAIESISYGEKSSDCSIKGKLLRLEPEVVLTWESDSYSSPELTTHIVGNYNFYNMLAAICIGNYFEVDPEKINRGLTSYIPENNRSQVHQTENNTLILDAYNANPTSVKSALESFALMNHPEKLFVLGDMLELGLESNELHKEVIDLSVSLGLQGLFVGPIYHEIGLTDNRIKAFKTKEEAEAFLRIAQPRKNLILLKGSRGIGLETLVSCF
jgi:UDP-N-acetylmuramoyl-tripeptide--D-alanyl-D-alanine ligase